MGRGQFNKRLSQLECVHRLAPPVCESIDPIFVSDFIHTVFENKSDYGLGESAMSAEWFSTFSERNKPTASKLIDKILHENGHVVSRKSIMEGIDKFNEGFEYVR